MNRKVFFGLLLLASLLSAKVFGVVATIFIICVLITFHELGHWLAARLSGIDVPVFSVGFGRADQAKHLGRFWGTDFQFRPFPLGGFIAPDPASFARASFSGRALTLFAGPGMNMLIPVVLFFFLFAAKGVPVVHTRDVYVTALTATSSVAREAGIKPGDVLYAINGSPVEGAEQLVQTMAGHKLETVTVEVGRGESRETIRLAPDASGRIGVALGVHLERSLKPVGLVEAFTEATSRSADMLWQTVTGYGTLLRGENLGQLSSLVGIVAEGSEQVNTGLASGIYFTCILSIALAVLNLLPLPGLDGGQLTLLLLERLRGRPLQPRTQGYLQAGVVIFFLGLFVLALYNDFVSLLGAFWATPALVLVVSAAVYMLLPLLRRGRAGS